MQLQSRKGAGVRLHDRGQGPPNLRRAMAPGTAYLRVGCRRVWHQSWSSRYRGVSAELYYLFKPGGGRDTCRRASCKAMQYFANFLVAEARKNWHHFESREEEESALIYNFVPQGRSSYQARFLWVSVSEAREYFPLALCELEVYLFESVSAPKPAEDAEARSHSLNLFVRGPLPRSTRT